MTYASALFDEGKHRFSSDVGSRQLKWTVDSSPQTWKAVLLSELGVAITAITAANPPVVTAPSHGLTTSHRVMIYTVVGMTQANTRFEVEVIDANSFRLKDELTGANVDGSAWTSYTSGGRIIPLSIWTDLDDLPGGNRIATVTVTNLTAAGGVLGCDNLVWPSVSGAADDIYSVAIYRDTGTESTSTLLAVIAEATGDGFPVDPDGNNIQVTVSSRGLIRL